MKQKYPLVIQTTVNIYIYIYLSAAKKNLKIPKETSAQWAVSVSLTCHFVLSKLYSEPSICASYQISFNLVKWF